MARTSIPPLRLRAVNGAPVDPAGDYVLYWMIAARRAGWSFALDRAVEWASELDRPLVVLEALRCDYPFASDRLHRFILDGMADNARALGRRGVRYHPWVEPRPRAGRGLLETLARRACVVVTDDDPAFFLPRMVAAAGRRLRIRLEAVDGYGLLPLRATGRAFPAAFGFRRFLQKELPAHLRAAPSRNPLAALASTRTPVLPREVLARWPAVAPDLLEGRKDLRGFPVDHGVAPVPVRGGAEAARRRWRGFRERALDRYHRDRRHPDAGATSGLSPYLHFGNVSVHEIFADVASHEGWRPGDERPRVTGKVEGWWRMGPGAEAFLEQLVTWRELAACFCLHRDDCDRFSSIPAWAERTLRKHRRDRRPVLYSFDDLREARTHDEIWNAAQRELRREGTIHNSLRMLWGKKVLEWSPDPETAAETLLRLNDAWALDGRDPSSCAGIFWTFGRHDRAFGPERPIFGTVRYMSSESARRKLRLREYLVRFGSMETVSDPRPRGRR